MIVNGVRPADIMMTRAMRRRRMRRAARACGVLALVCAICFGLIVMLFGMAGGSADRAAMPCPSAAFGVASRDAIALDTSTFLGISLFARRRDGETARDGQGMREPRAAQGLAALGNRTRLRLFRALVRAGNEGLNVGDLQRLLGVPGSTLAHHLATLARAGLVVQERRGREVVSRADYAAMRGLIEYLTEACCTGVRLEGAGCGRDGDPERDEDAA